ncbi:MAG: hypothetical protein HC822_02110 [Oscillochloris sp.]|nr:hypothetical protein [Oscillochloris sp.]
MVFAFLALLALQLSCGGSAGRWPGLLWLQSAAVPFSLPFTTAWAAVAGALAGGLSLLAGTFWFAALLAALPPARMAVAPAVHDSPPPPLRWIAAGLSLFGGVAAPAITSFLIEPLITQLQAGLTPFGDLALWPWAGLISLNSARQTVATLPSLALAVLMLVLAALAWLLTRLLALRDERQPDA